MNKPCLIIMAAGLGSRYGGLKQIDPVDNNGCAIIDYSIFDAARAGFEQLILIIKPELEADFDDTIRRRINGRVDIRYAYQCLADVPSGIEIPQGRTKPWGTAHAVLAAKDMVSGPFAAINADDFYGRAAFQKIYDFLCAGHGPSTHAMVGYRLKNTLTEFGHVSRGVCQTDGAGMLQSIVERTRIERLGDSGIGFTEDGGASYTHLDEDTLVSMNMWGFGANMMGEIERRFAPYLRAHLPKNPLKLEYFLPYVPDCLIRERLATVAVLPTEARWYGVTYHEDMPQVKSGIAKLREDGQYPSALWG